MKRSTFRFLVAAMTALSAVAAPNAPVSLKVVPERVSLHGSEASQQFVVTGIYADGLERDVTDQVKWATSASDIVEIAADGLLRPHADGAVRVTATLGKLNAAADVNVTGSARPSEFSFPSDIGSILTKKGCNGANCHGGVKGRGGLKLSAGSLYPKDDYEWIVKGGAYQVLTTEVKGERIPRVDVKNPPNSLILKKATLAIPHGGGRRFQSDSPEYRAILKWVQNGAPFGKEVSAENKVARLEIYPSTVALEREGKQRLVVTAVFTDGRREDFSHQALYVSNNRDVATVDESGVVKAKELGETAVLIRAAGQAVSATVGVIGDAALKHQDLAGVNFIDRHISEKLRKFRIPASATSSDAEFLRRICLDLTGTLPPPARVREFLASKDAHKREKLIDTLMGSPEFIDYWTYRFDDVYRVSVIANALPKWSQMYAEWVRDSIAKNKPYDQMARERLVAQGYSPTSRHYLPYNVVSPINEIMAEEVRVFFGRRLDCAQCHNHPYETWSQDQFWGLSAFFSRMFKMGDNGVADDYIIFDHPEKKAMGNLDVDSNLKVFHPRTKAELRPALLDGTVVNIPDDQNPRAVLADWMVKHPYFAEALVNRMWSFFFGRGIVDPVDDFRSTNPPTHPALLEELAANFRRNNHDLRYLIRTIVSSRTYQLSAEARPDNVSDKTNYSHAMPRALDAEVLLDAICDVTGVPEVFTVGVPDGQRAPRLAPAGTRAITLRQPEAFYSRFLDLYGRPNRLTVPERNGKANLGKALHMVAGSVYNEKLMAEDGRLQKLIRTGKKDSEIVEEFYLAALTRLPTQSEMTAIAGLIAQGTNREETLRDFVWALLCSREFAENH